jgi:predicted transcriptional regulator
MCAPDCQQAITVREMRRQNKSSEKRKGLEEIRGGLIHPVGEAAQRWNWVVSAATCPAIAILKAD